MLYTWEALAWNSIEVSQSLYQELLCPMKAIIHLFRPKFKNITFCHYQVSVLTGIFNKD